MEINELNKKQLVLLTLLITFVVSIGTGIVTVSLMKQVPQSVPQTINNVIQRTIEKVTTVETTPSGNDKKNDSGFSDGVLFAGNGDALVHIYLKNAKIEIPTTTGEGIPADTSNSNAIGQGVIISDIGLVLVDSNILNGDEFYRIVLDKTDFDASVLKKFNNGFTVLKISNTTETDTAKEEVTTTPIVAQ